MTDYSMYKLRENPFPRAGTLNPDSKDPRENGMIFQPALMEDKVEQLQQAVNDRLNMVYIMGLVHERGTGKSALLVYQMRQLKEKANNGDIWTTYIRCTSKDKVEPLCSRIIETWHETGKLWSMFEQLMLKYTHLTGSQIFTEAAVKVLFSHYTQPPRRLNLMRYFHLRKAEPLARRIAEFVEKEYGGNADIIETFAEIYLSEPEKLPEKLTARRVRNADEIDIIKELMQLNNYTKNTYHFLFMDQLEDLIANLTERTVTKFSLSMRRLLEASRKLATFVVTLHPDSEIRLDGQAAKHLTTLAPLARPHRVDLRPLKYKDEASIQLAHVYLAHFRTQDATDPLFPFTAKAIKLITLAHNGCIRDILRQLHYTLDFALSQKAPKIDYSFMKAHLQETVGFILKEHKLEKFEREVT